MHEFDYQRDPAQDLTSQKLRDSILQDCVSGSFDVVVLSPPCHTFSRALELSMGIWPQAFAKFAFPKGFSVASEQALVKVDQELLHVAVSDDCRNCEFTVVSSFLSILSSWAAFQAETSQAPRGTGPRCTISLRPQALHAGRCINAC